MAIRKNKDTEKTNLMQKFVDELIEKIEQCQAPWQQPWQSGTPMLPVNAVTGKFYKGVNQIYLMMLSPDLEDNRWCTFQQAKSQGWHIRKGASGRPIQFWSLKKEYAEDAETLSEEGEPAEEDKGRWICANFTVFHASQIDGIPKIEKNMDLFKDTMADPRLEEIARNINVKVEHGARSAYYSPTRDEIHLPPAETFFNSAFYNTIFSHELSHSTGHKSRLNRDLEFAFGTPEYAVEELRAEISASIIVANLGGEFCPDAQNQERGRELENSAAYLASWLKSLPAKERKKVLLDCIKDAQKIADFLMSNSPDLQKRVFQEPKEESLDKEIKENSMEM